MARLLRAALPALAVLLVHALPDAAPAQSSTPTMLPMVRARPPAARPPALRQASNAPITQSVSVRTDSLTGRAGPPRERWNDITPASANSGVYNLPVGQGHLGPSVLRVQVLLSRAFFSPGMLDGRWGRNSTNAVLWLQAREGLTANGVVDSATYARLVQLAGNPQTVVQRVLTAEDVRGPFLAIPGNIYEHARLNCSCYESLSEKLSELFHAKVELLQRLNPGVNLERLAAGARINVPNVRDANARPAGEVRQIVVSGSGNYLQALDANGRILYHFAATLGSGYDPSPEGDFAVTAIHPNPWWHYQPRLLAHVPDDRPNAMIPPGPNNAVGRVWMTLSAPHYGIHGTRSPETIGYAQSAGCVRLTNWDVMFLSARVTPGTPVAFRETRRGAAQPAPVRTTDAPRQPEGPRVLGVSVDSVQREIDLPAVEPAPVQPPVSEPPTAEPAPPPVAAPPPPPPAATDSSRARGR